MTIVIHGQLQLFGHSPSEFKKKTAKVTFPQEHALAAVASAVTNSTENRMFREQSRLKNTMKTLRHLMGTRSSFIFPPLEQTIAAVYSCGGMRRRAGGTMKRYHEKIRHTESSHNQLSSLVKWRHAINYTRTQRNKRLQWPEQQKFACKVNCLILDVFRFMCDRYAQIHRWIDWLLVTLPHKWRKEEREVFTMSGQKGLSPSAANRKNEVAPFTSSSEQ